MNKFQIILDIKPTAKEEQQQLQESCDHKLVHDSGHLFICTKCHHKVNVSKNDNFIKTMMDKYINEILGFFVIFNGLLQILQLFCIIYFFDKHFVNYIFIFTALSCFNLLILRKFYKKELKKLSLLEIIANICVICIGCYGLLRLCHFV